MTQAQNVAVNLESLERIADQIEQSYLAHPDIPETEKITLSKSRRGQGQFRARVLAVESRYRVSGISNPNLLIASHIKPWAKCNTNRERLDCNNGLMLAPNADFLFDRSYINFSDEGALLTSNALSLHDRPLLGITGEQNVGRFSNAQAKYLEYHRDHVFCGLK